MQNYTNFMLSFAMELNIHAFTQRDMYLYKHYVNRTRRLERMIHVHNMDSKKIYVTIH